MMLLKVYWEAVFNNASIIEDGYGLPEPMPCVCNVASFLNYRVLVELS